MRSGQAEPAAPGVGAHADQDDGPAPAGTIQPALFAGATGPIGSWKGRGPPEDPNVCFPQLLKAHGDRPGFFKWLTDERVQANKRSTWWHNSKYRPSVSVATATGHESKALQFLRWVAQRVPYNLMIADPIRIFGPRFSLLACFSPAPPPPIHMRYLF
jgi:hypothetical protein